MREDEKTFCESRKCLIQCISMYSKYVCCKAQNIRSKQWIIFKFTAQKNERIRCSGLQLQFNFFRTSQYKLFSAHKFSNLFCTNDVWAIPVKAIFECATQALYRIRGVTVSFRPSLSCDMTSKQTKIGKKLAFNKRTRKTNFLVFLLNPLPDDRF